MSKQGLSTRLTSNFFVRGYRTQPCVWHVNVLLPLTEGDGLPVCLCVHLLDGLQLPLQKGQVGQGVAAAAPDHGGEHSFIPADTRR